MITRGGGESDTRRFNTHLSWALLDSFPPWICFTLCLLVVWFFVLDTAGAQNSRSLPSGTATLSQASAPPGPGNIDASTTRAVVTMRSPAVVTSTDITLGAIADIATADANLQARLAALVVGRAALVGQERILSVGSVLVRFRQAGIAEAEVQIIAPSDTLMIRTAAVVVPATELTKVAEQAVKNALAAQVGTGAPSLGLSAAAQAVNHSGATVACPTLPRDVPVPGGTQYDVRVSGPVAFSPLSDQVTVPLAIWSAGQLQQEVTARCTVVAGGEVAILARKMDLRETLSESDIRWEKRNLASVPGGAVTRSANFSPAAWRLLRPQEPGVILTWDMIEAQPNAQADAAVDIVTNLGAVQITDLGRLLKDSRVGERVAVRNARTGSIVYGVLKSPSQVVVTP